MEKTSDGGYIVSCVVVPLESYEYIGVAKLDNNLEEVWVEELTDFYGTPVDVLETQDGGYIILVSGYESLLIKTNNSGDMQWFKSLDMYQPLAVRQAGEAGFVVAGNIYYEDGYGPCLVKTDADGEKLSTVDLRVAGGEAVDMIETDDGNYALAGNTYTSGGYDPDCTWLAKVQPDGELIWSRTYEGNDIIVRMVQADDGDYAIAGTVAGGELWNTTILRTDSDGDLLWKKTNSEDSLSITGLCPAGGNSVAVMNCQAIPLYENRIAKINPSGSKTWLKRIGSWSSPIIGADIKRADDATFVVVGTILEFSLFEETLTSDTYVFRLDESGNPM